jgi:ketosteroid isomerase-like protein
MIARKETSSMGASENKDLVQRIFAELAKGDSRPLVERMADDCRWIVTGGTTWSGTYDGKKAVIGDLFGPLRAAITDRVRTIAHRFIAESDHVVVEARGSNTTVAGLSYDNTYCFVLRLADGKVSEVTEYADTQLVAAVLGERVIAR